MPLVRRKPTRRAHINLSSDKRTKRPPRGQSPAVTSTPATSALNSLQKITLPARNSVGPASNIPFSREPKARREALAAQLPLQEGRKVAFHPPTGSGTNGPTDESTWILAVVTKCINQDKNRSVVFHLPCRDNFVS
jgi:SAGA-associated factor 29